MPPLEELIRQQLEESARVKQSFSTELIQRITAFAEKSAALRNGGSASDAIHLSAELVVRLRATRPGLPSLALTANPSVLTAAANDFGFEQIFARQIESLARSPLAATGRTFFAALKPAEPAKRLSRRSPANRAVRSLRKSTCF
jgi:phosphoheptose isomerase